MLETLGTYAESPFDAPQFLQLTPDVYLVAWDPPHAVNAAPRLEELGSAQFSAMASVRLALLDGRSRIIWALAPKDKSRLSLKLTAGTIGSGAELTADFSQSVSAVDPFALTNGLTQNACASLVTTILNTWAGMFKLARSRSFVGFATKLLQSVNDAPSVADCVASVSGTYLLETFLNSECAEISSAILIGDAGVKRLDGDIFNESYNNGRNRLFLGTVDLAQPPARSHLVLSGPWGLAIRRLEAEGAARSLGTWWASNARKLPEVRDYLITRLGGRTPTARAAVRDLQLAEPMPARRYGALGETAAFCAVETAISVDSGVLVGGWMRDPGKSIEGLDVLTVETEPVPLELHAFDGVLPETQGGYPIKKFVAFAPTGGALRHHIQPRLELRLASGERTSLVPPPQPSDAAESRANALSIIPPRHATDALISGCLAQPLADLQDNFRKQVGGPTEILIGTQTQNPVVSIVIPLYKIYEFMKPQLAAFAADRWLAENAEIIFVLDSPEQATHVEDLLIGFHLLYGLPIRMIVMEQNGGYALACNAGASKANGRYLAMVNSDVVPLDSGWLEQLCACLMMDEQVGAAGAKLLYADNAIQHAGLKFIQDEKGRWFNHHYFKGFPRHFPQASTSREVPGVTGACLVLSRSDFEEAGGYTTDFIIGDYEDSDLCLKLRSSNKKIYYLGDVELYHFERVSISKNGDYTRGVASQYNRWLQQFRWEQEIMDVMSSIGARDGMAI
ncbi:MAG: glycosyltransferase [Roseibium album]|uniref:glycosyltransferase family 2 protein n=1 Tax=Roseibium album TaxID=311410 RepID=UPI0018C9B964|nr:glycosyltransferase [Roseibium album]MBG6159161.1 GT2 family glycosyltransferase [Labrenzia sp. EL_162]MBG6197751.1 GT2 family glycosyltransferase [Labrenzia sp. EL_159]